MIGALITRIVMRGASKAASKGASAAGKAASKGASKAKASLRKKIGGIASKAMSAAGFAALMGGGKDGAAAAGEQPTAATIESGSGARRAGEKESIPASDPLISLAGLGKTIASVLPAIEENLPPIKREESKTAVVIRKDVPIQNGVIRAGTYIETRIDQIATLFQITDSLRQSVGLLQANLTDVSDSLENIEDGIEEAIEQNRQTSLSNERRRDEAASEESGIGARLKDGTMNVLGQGADLAKAGLLMTLAKYSKALVAGSVLAALTAFSEESEASDEETNVELSESEDAEIDGALAALGVGAVAGAGAAAVANRKAKNAALRETAEAATKATGKTIATEGAEAATKAAGKTIATEGAEAIGKTAVKETIEKAIPKIAAKEISKTAGKSVPVLGWVVGGGLAVYQLARGNPAGAALDAASSLAGPVTGIPMMVASIADEVYHAVYGTFAGNDLVKLGADIVGNRMDEIKESVSQYVADYFENNAEYPEDEEALKSAIKKGIYDLDYLGDSEVDLSRLNELTEREIKAIIAENDIDAETKDALLYRLEEFAKPAPPEEPIKTVNGFRVRGPEARPTPLQGKEIPGVQGETGSAETAIPTRRDRRGRVIPDDDLTDKITMIAQQVSKENAASIIPLIFNNRSPKPDTSAIFPAGSGFPSEIESSQPSYQTRDPFVSMEFQT